MNAVVRPATSWMSVLGGWIATIGAMGLVSPAVAGVLVGANTGASNDEIAPAVPVVIGIFISYLIGGYVAGRMAGYRTSWHGMLTAFFSLFVLGVLVLTSYAAANGAFAGVGVNNLPLSPGAALAKAWDSEAVYLISNGQKRWVSEAAMERYGISGDQIHEVAPILLQSIPDGPDMVLWPGASPWDAGLDASRPGSGATTTDGSAADPHAPARQL